MHDPSGFALVGVNVATTQPRQSATVSMRYVSGRDTEGIPCCGHRAGLDHGVTKIASNRLGTFDVVKHHFSKPKVAQGTAELGEANAAEFEPKCSVGELGLRVLGLRYRGA
jgi:hypothetical protein